MKIGPIKRSVAYMQPYFKGFFDFALFFSLFMGGSIPHEFDQASGDKYPYITRSEPYKNTLEISWGDTYPMAK